MHETPLMGIKDSGKQAATMLMQIKSSLFTPAWHVATGETNYAILTLSTRSFGNLLR